MMGSSLSGTSFLQADHFHTPFRQVSKETDIFGVTVPCHKDIRNGHVSSTLPGLPISTNVMLNALPPLPKLMTPADAVWLKDTAATLTNTTIIRKIVIYETPNC